MFFALKDRLFLNRENGNTPSRHALLKKGKSNWLAVEVYIGRVNDNGIHEEKVSFDNDLGHGYCGFLNQASVRIVPQKDVLQVILQRHLQNLLITEKV